MFSTCDDRPKEAVRYVRCVCPTWAFFRIKVRTYKKGEKDKYQLIVKPSKWKELKAKLKLLTRKTVPASFDEQE